MKAVCWGAWVFLAVATIVLAVPIPTIPFTESTNVPSLASDIIPSSTVPLSASDNDDGADDEDDDSMSTGEIIKYVMIPFISGLIGYGTNVVALKMTFYPLTWWGIPQKYTCGLPMVGWQGIIPMKAGKMAGRAVDLLTEKLIDVAEIFSRLDPDRVASLMEPAILELIRTLLAEVAEEVVPSVWRMLPSSAKEELYAKASEEAPRHIASMMAQIKDNIKEVFDVRKMVVDALVRDKELLNQIFIRCGGAELVFIEHSGFYLGFAFGIVQALVWFYYKGSWVLPAFGFLVGYATNMIALKVIFEPVEPVTIGPWTMQGLFIKRQREVSAEYAKVVSSEVLHAKVILMAIIRGPASDRLFHILCETVSTYIDAAAGATQPIIHIALTPSEFQEVKHHICARMFEELPHSLEHVYVYADEALNIRNTLEEKMSELPPTDFEQALHPVFQEDEWKLILVGAILGMAVGFFQLLIVFA